MVSHSSASILSMIGLVMVHLFRYLLRRRRMGTGYDDQFVREKLLNPLDQEERKLISRGAFSLVSDYIF